MREGIIKKINWDKLNCELAAEAMDGIEALQLLEPARPHIMLTDIRMPEMDGLQLVQSAKQRFLDLVCIIISGHSDFEYAREAMKYGVNDYILKPVDAEELNRVLAERLEKLEEQSEHKQYRRSLELEYEQAKEEVRELSLTRLAGQDSGLSGSDLQVWFPGLGGEDEIGAVVIALEPFKLPHISFGVKDEALIWFGMRNIIEECLSSLGQTGIVFRHASRSLEMVVFFTIDCSIKHPPRWVERSLEGIRRWLRLKATAGIGQSVQLHEGLANAYATASEAVQSKAVHGPGQIYQSSVVNPHLLTMNGVLPSQESIRYLYSMLDHGRADVAYKWIKECLYKLKDIPESGYVHLDCVCLEINAILIRYYLQRAGNMHSLEKEKVLPYRYRTRFQNIEEAAEQLMHIVDAIVRQDGKPTEMTGEQIVGEVRRYIDRFYYQNITLGWIAETFYIHANYFSRIFRETTGQSFSDYMTTVRMKNAKSMLEDPAIPVQQIGYLIGYDNPSYFSSVFRKHSGLSPSKYREQIQG